MTIETDCVTMRNIRNKEKHAMRTAAKVVYQKGEFLQEITSSGQRKHVTQRKIKFL